MIIFTNFFQEKFHLHILPLKKNGRGYFPKIKVLLEFNTFKIKSGVV